MSTPSSDQPTQVLPSTAEQPAATTQAPAPAAFWRQRVPAHIGRARTSTVVLSVLFLAFFALYLLVRPAVEYTTVRTESGQMVRVPVADLAPTPEPTESSEPTAPTTEVPTTGTPTTEAPATTEPDEPTPTSVPRTTTAPRSTPSSTPGQDEEGTTGEPTAGTTTTRAPATTEEPAAVPDPGETSAPTG
jgi:hypothetical protein